MFCCIATQLLSYQQFRMVLEDNGSQLDIDVIEALFAAQEKIGTIMFLRDGEEWSPGYCISIHYLIVANCTI